MNAFFRFNAERPLVFLVNSRRDINKIYHRKTENWMIGWQKGNTVFILSPEKYAKESSHPRARFWKALKHELAHYYFIKLITSLILNSLMRA